MRCGVVCGVVLCVVWCEAVGFFEWGRMEKGRKAATKAASTGKAASKAAWRVCDFLSRFW